MTWQWQNGTHIYIKEVCTELQKYLSTLVMQTVDNINQLNINQL